MGTLRDRLQQDLRAAMARRDAMQRSVLRTTLAAIANAEAVDPTRPIRRAGLMNDMQPRKLSEAEIHQIVRRERDELRAWGRSMEAAGQAMAALRLAAQAAVLDAYVA